MVGNGGNEVDTTYWIGIAGSLEDSLVFPSLLYPITETDLYSLGLKTTPAGDIRAERDMLQHSEDGEAVLEPYTAFQERRDGRKTELSTGAQQITLDNIVEEVYETAPNALAYYVDKTIKDQATELLEDIEEESSPSASQRDEIIIDVLKREVDAQSNRLIDYIQQDAFADSLTVIYSSSRRDCENVSGEALYGSFLDEMRKPSLGLGW